jgi:hypothetical protein
MSAMPYAARPLPAPPITIDHLILGVSDLARGVEEFTAKTGVRPVFGGVHPNRGTQNALASLGGGAYIEVIAPDPKQSVESPMLSELEPLAALKPIGWAVGARDVNAVRAYLESLNIRTGGVRPGARAKQDGSRLEWSTLDILSPRHELAPFVIQWSAVSAHPSTTSPAGCTLQSLAFADPRPEIIDTLLRTLTIKAAIDRGSEPRMTIVLQCPAGRVTF